MPLNFFESGKGQEFHLNPAHSTLVTHSTENGELKPECLECLLVFWLWIVRVGYFSKVRFRVGVRVRVRFREESALDCSRSPEC